MVKPVSNHPQWLWQALAGILLASAVFAVVALLVQPNKLSLARWVGALANAVVPGIFVGWAIANIPVESFGVGGWARSLALLAVVLVAPLAGTAALVRGIAVPPFARLGRPDERPSGLTASVLGTGLAILTVLAIQVALGLVFDPRYRDFPFVPLTAATTPYAMLAIVSAHRGQPWPSAAETIAAITLALSAIYIALNETMANWQAVWLSAVLLVLVLARLRAGRNS